MVSAPPPWGRPPWGRLVDLFAVGLPPAVAYVGFMWIIDGGSVAVLVAVILAWLAFILWRIWPSIKPAPGESRRLSPTDAAKSFLLFVPWIGLMATLIAIPLSAFPLLFKPAPRCRAAMWLILCLSAMPVHFTYNLLLARARDMGKSSGCAMNLSNLGKAIGLYRVSYDNQYPPNLNAILRDGQSGKGLMCPHDPALRDNLWDEREGSSYFYCTPQNNDGYDMPNDDASIIACDIAPFHLAAVFRFDRCRNVLLSNGSVQRYTESEFQQDLQKPQNRRFAEEWAKGEKMSPQKRLHYIAPRGGEK